MSLAASKPFALEAELAALDPGERDAAALSWPPIRRASARRWRS